MRDDCEGGARRAPRALHPRVLRRAISRLARRLARAKAKGEQAVLEEFPNAPSSFPARCSGPKIGC